MLLNKSYFSLIAGFSLFVAAFVVSADALFQVFGKAGEPMQAEFANGARLFKISLGVLGAYILVVRLLPVHQQFGAAAIIVAPASRRQNIIFAVLLAAATLLRIYSLNTGIWFDEMLTYVIYMPLRVGEILGTFKDPNNHLLFSVLARISLSVFGDTVWAFRLPAVVFGVASIAALYYFARRVSSTTVALFSVALLTLSYHHIWFSQNARGYTALLFFTLASSTFLLDALRTNDRRRWMYYGVTAALGMFTHLTMAFVVLSHFLIYVYVQIRRPAGAGWQRADGLLFGFIPAGLLSVQAYALILPGMLAGDLLTSGLQGNSIEWTNPVWALLEVVNGLQVSFSNSGVALIAASILGIGLIDLARKKSHLVGLFLIPTLIGLTLMTSIGYTLFPRFFFFAMAFAVVVVMHGATVAGQFIGRLVKQPVGKAAWLPTVMCAGIILASLPSLRYVYFPKQNFAAAIELIEREKSSDDTVVTVGIADFPFNRYYGKAWKNVKSVEELDEIAPQAGRTWLVYTMPVHAKSAYPQVLARIDQDYELVKRFYGSLNGGDVVISRQKTVSQ